MESAAPQTPVQALEALQDAYSRFLDALPEARQGQLGGGHRLLPPLGRQSQAGQSGGRLR